MIKEYIGYFLGFASIALLSCGFGKFFNDLFCYRRVSNIERRVQLKQDHDALMGQHLSDVLIRHQRLIKELEERVSKLEKANDPTIQ